MNARYKELVDCIRRKALRIGEFRLSSGGVSKYYLDGKMLSFDPEGIALIVDAILAELKGVEFDAFGGMDMGATPISSAFALRTHQLGAPVPTFTVRKEEKSHGTSKKIEGPLPPASRVVVVDDVVTSGASIMRAVEALREAGHEVVLAISIVDRDAGGRELLESQGIPYHPLVTLAELGVSNGDDS